MTKKSFSSLLVAGAMLTSLSSVSMARTRTLPASDHTFLNKATQGNWSEVQMGRLALQKAIDPDVRDFAQRMVDDHSKALRQVRGLARSFDVTVPDHLNAKQRDEMRQLSSLSGHDFDRQYVDMMVADHQEDVGEFRHASVATINSQVRNWASQTTPTLEDHLRMIERIDRRMNGRTEARRWENRHRMGGANRPYLTDQEKIDRGWH